ncbi:MAG: rRNA maturation RNase YbeY [candidate division Zixibacteria bacterium]|nr:rRNA maturation RNase YbeY [candidate division Zixibacteria bacterium]
MPRRTKISVENLHPNYKPDKKKIASLAKRILSAHRSNLDLDIILVKDQFIRQLNKNFRRKDKVTDVLSFGMREGEKIGLELNYLGDVYVCLDQARRQAKEYKIPFAEEVYRLITHGILHLLGYEHKTKEQTKGMKKKEELFIAQVKNMKR